VIDIQNVSKYFSKKAAVKNLSLTIKSGEVYGFLGPNGAGKTTTMKMILGLLKPDSGKILLFGKHAGLLDVRKKIGFLPEFAHFYQHLTGAEFLSFVGEIFHLSPVAIEKRSKQLLRMVNLPTESHNRQIGTYSKGMQQRIGMAQALMNDPEILFLDEPMSGLDPIGRREMKDIILSLKEQGKTIFFNSHILADAEAICDRVGIIHQGQLLLDDQVKNVVSRTKSLEDVFVETITKKTSPSKKNTSPKSTSPKKNTSSKSTSSKKNSSPSQSAKKNCGF
jgi:ABC-2 type transport system ATP-binding protein